jgi:hypothetical protein
MHRSTVEMILLLFFFLSAAAENAQLFCLPAEASELFERFLQGFLISENFPDGKREK